MVTAPHRRNQIIRQETDFSLAEAAEIAEQNCFAGRETARPAKSIRLIFRREMFLLWRLSLPEQKMNPSVYSVLLTFKI